MLDAGNVRWKEEAMSALSRKAQRLSAEYGVPQHPSGSYDIGRQQLEFRDDHDRVYLVAHVVFIGTYLEEMQSWMWAWGNELFPQAARDRSSQLKTLGRVAGCDAFARELVEGVAPQDALEFTALAVEHLGAIASYRFGSRLQFYAAITQLDRVLQ